MIFRNLLLYEENIFVTVEYVVSKKHVEILLHCYDEMFTILIPIDYYRHVIHGLETLLNMLQNPIQDDEFNIRMLPYINISPTDNIIFQVSKSSNILLKIYTKYGVFHAYQYSHAQLINSVQYTIKLFESLTEETELSNALENLSLQS